jgi:signal transduction histidine kinase
VVSIKTKNIGQQLEVRVKDNGEGISQQVSEKVFTPFFTTKPPGQGTGLGLSLSHSIITQHQGTLTFTTKAQEYTEFVVTLPTVMRG